MEFHVGQDVKYKGQETHIDFIYDKKTCRIANPAWDWDMEALCVNLDIDYDIPYWITVKFKDLAPAPP